MKIMAINSGSSSLKFQLFEMPEERVITKGLFDRIGFENSELTITVGGLKEKIQVLISNHEEAVAYLLEVLVSKQIISNLDEIKGVGHRVAHGGSHFKETTIVDEEVENEIEKLSELAPLHNPINLVGIRAFRKVLPYAMEVAVFDTSFHQTMKEEQYLYTIPYKYKEKYGIRRYGFHGISHQYIARNVSERLGDNLKVINCHLGNGASICAIKDGKSFITSMGFTPTSGIMMGTRAGDIDPSIITFVQRKEGIDADRVEAILNKESGLKGISGISSDCRDIEEAAASGNQRAITALEIYANRIYSTIGAYVAEMNGLDVLVFTAGVGENSPGIRKCVCDHLTYLGVKIDDCKNRNGELYIQTEDSSIPVMIIPTNEELMIVKEVVTQMYESAIR